VQAPDAFRTISEVAEDLDLPQHVLRFWETRFAQIKPMKRGGGRRYYRPEDIDLLRGIRLLLYSEGFTIRGVQRLLKEKGLGFVAAVGQAGSMQTVTERTAATGGRSAERQPPRLEPPAAPAEAARMQGEGREPEEPEQPLDMRSLAPRPAPAPPATTLGRESRRKLEIAMGELLEAKRLLDQVR
jgi:DNA-binding transcriptional MerR regulator